MPSSEYAAINLKEAVDRQSPVPYYHQLKEYLVRLIQSGVLKPGDRLPTEMEICMGSGLSRTAVRQAIQELENGGYINRYRAKGTFVTRPRVKERLIQTLTGFHEDTIAQGQVPRTTVLNFEVIPATFKIAHELQLSTGEPVIYLNRLRFIDQEPVVLVSTYIPQIMCPGLIQLDMSSQSLYKVLVEKYNLVIVRANRSLEAVEATSEEARLLEVEAKSPLLLLKSTGYLADKRPLEYFVALHRGDRAKFDVELVRVPPETQ